MSLTPLGAVARGAAAGAFGTLAMDTRLLEGLFQRDLPPRSAARTNNVTHWAYGMLGAAQYGLAAGSLSTAAAFESLSS